MLHAVSTCWEGLGSESDNDRNRPWLAEEKRTRIRRLRGDQIPFKSDLCRVLFLNDVGINATSLLKIKKLLISRTMWTPLVRSSALEPANKRINCKHLVISDGHTQNNNLRMFLIVLLYAGSSLELCFYNVYWLDWLGKHGTRVPAYKRLNCKGQYLFNYALQTARSVTLNLRLPL